MSLTQEVIHRSTSRKVGRETGREGSVIGQDSLDKQNKKMCVCVDIAAWRQPSFVEDFSLFLFWSSTD